MAEIDELQARIAAALDQASKTVERLGGPDESALESLRAELEAERAATKQLEERVRALRSENEAGQKKLQDEVEAMRDALAAQSSAAERLKRVNGELTATMKVLREAQTADLVDAHLIDKAMKKELDALHAAQEADRAEMAAILSALEPMMQESQDA
ncbi:hypothetical protein [Roseitranquillus sediminis]|uniref:hypothetical protein n=1 Tax=Roseitranquillus sediminis TaxID=2809051 RepID=UPI001D0C3A23|nr:hypothetical protein [Roseitranquillus sediminis]MBM9596040.1 hypothetical protein [Roseitranquillus sediminis]